MIPDWCHLVENSFGEDSLSTSTKVPSGSEEEEEKPPLVRVQLFLGSPDGLQLWKEVQIYILNNFLTLYIFIVLAYSNWPGSKS